MKKTILLLFAGILVQVTTLYAQLQLPSVKEVPARITLSNGNVLEGTAFYQNRTRPTIAFKSVEQAKKQVYTAQQILTARLGDLQIESIDGEFFTFIAGGNEWSLVEKISSSGETIQYNGNEPILIPNKSGNKGDWFLLKKNRRELLSVSDPSAKKIIAENFLSGLSGSQKISDRILTQLQSRIQ